MSNMSTPGRISQLPAAPQANLSDQLEANQGGTSRSITVAQVINTITAEPPSGPAGGDLAGTYPNPTIKSNIALGGSATAVTQPVADNDTSIATTAFVKAAIAAFPPPVAMPDGTVALPGMPFASDLDTGFYRDNAAPYGGSLAVSVQGTQQAEFIWRPAAIGGFDNTWLLLGPGTPVTNETTDTYVSTISVQSFNWSGTASRPVGINVGTASCTITDTITKTALACMGELDKLDIHQTGGPVTVTRAGGWRVRSPNPLSGVTVTNLYNLLFTDPSAAIGGTVTNHAYIYLPPVAGGANGPATSYGILFEGAPNGGSIATISGYALAINGSGIVTLQSGVSSAINITAGTGSNAGDVTIKGNSTNLDTRVASGRVTLNNNGVKVVEVGSSSGANYLVVDANSAVTLRPNHATTTNLDIFISGKGTGSVYFDTSNGSVHQVEVLHTASAANRIQLTGAPTGANAKIRTSAENLILGLGSQLLTTATAGHIMIPSCAGTPTGAPTAAGTGAIPFIYDTTANKLWVYNGSWRGVVVT